MAYRGATAREKAHAMDVEAGLRENDARLSALSDQVSLLKGLATEIDGEVQSQNSFLDTMGGSLAGAGGALERTMAALEQMTARGGARFGLMVAAAVVLLF